MNRIQELEGIIDLHNLNQHPFYQEWRAGTLPKEKLVDYSGEYGQFISTIALGWETIGETGYANEEREHEELWDNFKEAVNFEKLSLYPQSDTVVKVAKNLFSTKPEAIGALYAFEFQQPETTQSKLTGLNEHYSISDEGKKYFETHAGDFAEVNSLKQHISQLTENEFARAKTACSLMSTAMWGALDGIYYV